MMGAISFGPSDSRCDAQMIVIVARYRARPGAAEDVAAALREYTPLVRAESGCVGFAAHRNRDDPDEFMLYESYRGQAEFDAHASSPHYATIARDRIRPLLSERSVTFYEPLDA